MHTGSRLGSWLESQIRRQLYLHPMLPAEGGVAVALSGGKDSLTLLHLLTRISGRGFRRFPITAIHIGGAFSCGAGVTTGFLQRTCDGLGVPLVIRETEQRLEELECYSCSRRRRSLLFAAALEHDCSVLAFGHHRDDAVQTLMMNLLHKGEFAGLLPVVPMHRYGVTIIRPLIQVEEEAIRRFAQQAGFARITCQCPVGAQSQRKKTAELLSQLEAVFPNALTNLALAADRYGSQKAAAEPLRRQKEGELALSSPL